MYHRMAWVERDLQDQLLPTFCHGQGHLTVQVSETSLFLLLSSFLGESKNATNANVLLVGRITGNMTKDTLCLLGFFKMPSPQPPKNSQLCILGCCWDSSVQHMKNRIRTKYWREKHLQAGCSAPSHHVCVAGAEGATWSRACAPSGLILP